MIPYTWILEAQERLAEHIRCTPLTYDAELDLYVKWENQQITGSFKARGALNKVLTLQEWERQRGLVAASAGNHGQGLALAGRLCNAPVIIFASEHASPTKIAAMQSMGAEVHLVSGGYREAEAAGLEYASQHQATWVSPYNDGQVIAGQGSLGLEILKDLPELPQATWVVPVGGGGLISGIGAALKTNTQTKHRLIGVQSEASPFMHALFHLGSQANVVELASLADGLSGPVEQGSLTIPMTRQLVDDMRLVSEAEIVQAMTFAWQRYHECIEGSAATTLAAIITGRVPERPAVVVISGGNVKTYSDGAPYIDLVE